MVIDTPRTPRRKRLTGVVVSAGKMAQTITVLVERRPWHPKVKKQYRRSKAYLVHDARGAARVGDRVVMEETRPLSKRKHFRLVSVEQKGESGEGFGTLNSPLSPPDSLP